MPHCHKTLIMTPRQKKRQMRASANSIPLVFIRHRALNTRMTAAVGRAMHEYLTGQKRAAEAIRDHVKRELIDLVLRPLVRRVVRDMAGVMQ